MESRSESVLVNSVVGVHGIRDSKGNRDQGFQLLDSCDLTLPLCSFLYSIGACAITWKFSSGPKIGYRVSSFIFISFTWKYKRLGHSTVFCLDF